MDHFAAMGYPKMAQDTALKPCPFCGYEFPLIGTESRGDIYRIHCPDCDSYFHLAAGEKQRIKERLIAVWNRRTTEVLK